MHYGCKIAREHLLPTCIRLPDCQSGRLDGRSCAKSLGHPASTKYQPCSRSVLFQDDTPSAVLLLLPAAVFAAEGTGTLVVPLSNPVSTLSVPTPTLPLPHALTPPYPTLTPPARPRTLLHACTTSSSATQPTSTPPCWRTWQPTFTAWDWARPARTWWAAATAAGTTKRATLPPTAPTAMAAAPQLLDRASAASAPRDWAPRRPPWRLIVTGTAHWTHTSTCRPAQGRAAGAMAAADQGMGHGAAARCGSGGAGWAAQLWTPWVAHVGMGH